MVIARILHRNKSEFNIQMDKVDKEVEKIVSEVETLSVVVIADGKVRVRCSVTQRDLLPNKEEITRYLASKKYKKAKEWYGYDFSKYEPFIVPHKSNKKRLFCNVTSMYLNKIPEQVERHVNGKKFQRLKKDVTSVKNETVKVESEVNRSRPCII